MPTKNDDNTQFARIANSSGNNPLGGGGSNDGTCLLTDEHGRLLVVPTTGGVAEVEPPIKYDSAANVTWGLVYNDAVALYQAFGSQNSGIDLWVHFRDIAAGPLAGVSDIAPIPCPDGSAWSVSFPQGWTTGNGLVIGYSINQSSVVLPTNGGWITALYRYAP